MTRGRHHAEESVLEAGGEEPKRDLVAGIGSIDTAVSLWVADTLDAVDVGAEAPAVEPVDRLRRHQRALRLGGIRVGVGEKVRPQDDQIEANNHAPAGHGHAMLAEPPPHQLPLRGHEDTLTVRRDGDRPLNRSARGIEAEGGVGHQVSSSRMRGSINTRRMSDTSVPITVITPSSSTIVPARNMSCETRAFSRSGPTVGNPSTIDTMM